MSRWLLGRWARQPLRRAQNLARFLLWVSRYQQFLLLLHLFDLRKYFLSAFL
jgi:hypothetical protein